MKTTLNRSAAAGVLICMGCIVNLKVGGGIPGAVLFSAGLWFVVNFDAELFTGRVARNDYDPLQKVIMLVMNVIGAAVCGILASLCLPEIREAAQKIAAGDRTETAIIRAYVGNGGNIHELFDRYPRCAEIPFDASRRLMTVIYEVDGIYMTVTKGAPDVLISRCVELDTDEIDRQAKAMFDDGLKVIAVAVQSLDQLPEKITPETVEHNLTFIGLLGLDDPCREDVGEAIDICTEAGIRTVMITGDHPETAASLARRLHILRDGEGVMTGEELAAIPDDRLCKCIGRYSVFARITPEDKVRIIKCWQSKGACVLMTAGGMTDAPALHKADISCSVEATATDVAVDAADITLSDSSFVNFSSMIKQGRRIRKNLRNLRIWIAGLYIVFNSITAYLIGCGYFRVIAGSGGRTADTMAFAAMGLGLALHAFCSRSEKPLASAGIFRNYKMLLSVLFIAAVIVLMITLPWVSGLMGFVALSVREWCAVGILLLIQLAVWEYPKIYVSVKCR